MEGIKPPTSSIVKGKGEGTSHQIQAPFDDQTRNEMKIAWLYESTCVGFLKVPKVPNGVSHSLL